MTVIKVITFSGPLKSHKKLNDPLPSTSGKRLFQKGISHPEWVGRLKIQFRNDRNKW